MLPQFVNQPDEVSELQPLVVAAIQGEGYKVYVEKTCDLLIVRENKSPLNLELKVRLGSQNQKVPVTPFQWQLFRNVNDECHFSNESRILIYDVIKQCYAFVKIPVFSLGLTKSNPKSTSYVTKKVLDDLLWQSPEITWNSIKEWINSD